MTDIDAYTEFQNYMVFQKKRPDYTQAVQKVLELGNSYLNGIKNPVIADFCCGIANNTKSIADSTNGLKKAILIDINEGFLEIAAKSGINSKKLEIQKSDILQAKLKKEADLVLSVFAYHHVPDSDKYAYIMQVKKSLKKGGILILAEIYLKNKEEAIRYYSDLFESISENERVKGLQEFLMQTANSSDFEFKTIKEFADAQFREAGFMLLSEDKIWPEDESIGKNRGTYIQAYKL